MTPSWAVAVSVGWYVYEVIMKRAFRGDHQLPAEWVDQGPLGCRGSDHRSHGSPVSPHRV